MNEKVDTASYESEFKTNDLMFEYGSDEPGKVYRPHRHGWTRLVTVAGSITITRDTDTFEQRIGDVCEIESGQLHEAVVGPDGWDWLAAWKPEEDDTFKSHE